MADIAAPRTFVVAGSWHSGRAEDIRGAHLGVRTYGCRAR